MIIAGQQKLLPLKSGIATLVYANPDLNNNNKEHLQTFYNNTNAWISEAVRVMHPVSRLVVCVGRSPTSLMFENLLSQYLPFDEELIWQFNFGTYTRKHFVPSHEKILVFRKGNSDFNWEAVAESSQRLESGDDRADIRGRTPGSVFNIPRVPGNSKQRRSIGKGYKFTHRPFQPFDLCNTIIRAYTRPTDLVVDMFAGSSSICKAAHQTGRRFFGIDTNHWVCKAIKDRIDNNWKHILMEEL